MIGEDGRITDEAPERFRGLDGGRGARRRRRRAARAGADLRHAPVRARRAALAPVGPARGAADLAPVVLRHGPAREPAIDVVRDGQIRFHPEKPWTGVYLNWLENIRPWCISRQLWWGHQLPVWYRGEETYVGETEPSGEGWERDPDVLDTWFSSGLWPFATLGWPEATDELRAFYPTDVLLDGARHHLPLGRPHGDVRQGAHRAGAVHGREHPLGDPGAGRAADVEVARHGHRPIRPDPRRPAPARVRGGRRVPGLRRRRASLRAAGDVVLAGRALQRGAREAGPRPRQQALERRAARSCCAWRTSSRTRARRAASRTAGSCRGSSGSPSASRSCTTTSASRSRRSSSTAASGPSWRTGTSSSRSRACTRTTTRRCRRSCCGRWSASCACSTR